MSTRTKIANQDPSAGDVTLMPVGDGLDCQTQFYVTNDPGTSFQNMNERRDQIGMKNIRTSSVGRFGSAMITCTVKPGERSTVSVIFAWYFSKPQLRTDRLWKIFMQIFGPPVRMLHRNWQPTDD